MSTAGFFYDGVTAGRREAGLEFGESTLRIVATDGTLLADWPYACLQMIEPMRTQRPGMFGCTQNDDARLAVTDAMICAELTRRSTGHAKRRRHKYLKPLAAWTGGAVVLAALMWLAWNPVLDIAARAVPFRWEAALGRSALEQLAPNATTCRNSEGQAALDALVRRLSGAAGPQFVFDARVVRNKVVNAFALPGGYIVVMSGLIDKATSPDELAGVLAHEIAHVTERHTTRLLMRHYGMSMLVSTFLGSSYMASAVSSLGLIAYTREFEAEADARALEMLKSAGLRSGGLASFFTRMEKGEPGDLGLLRYLNTHPPSAERRALAQRHADGGNAPMTEQEWQALRAICPKT